MTDSLKAQFSKLAAHVGALRVAATELHAPDRSVESVSAAMSTFRGHLDAVRAKLDGLEAEFTRDLQAFSHGLR